MDRRQSRRWAMGGAVMKVSVVGCAVGSTVGSQGGGAEVRWRWLCRCRRIAVEDGGGWQCRTSEEGFGGDGGVVVDSHGR
ncbi:hypothetical protein U1Q18_028192 [Sarracenia purpurea var. burkii]